MPGGRSPALAPERAISIGRALTVSSWGYGVRPLSVRSEMYETSAGVIWPYRVSKSEASKQTRS